MTAPAYIGRFAPSPTGALHAGSLVAALASWLDARAHGGRWLVRIEDTDTPRCVPGADRALLQQLSDCGLHPDLPPVWQSQRLAYYEAALSRLLAQDLAYPCACSRKEIEAVLAASGQPTPRHHEPIYPGTCSNGLQGRVARAWRLRSKAGVVRWTDRRLGPQHQDVQKAVGDFVLKRADGLFAYQLAVVVDDAAQGVSHVVRGEDLADNTARQIQLQAALQLPQPQYLHTPLVRAANGEKLSKQNGAQAIATHTPELALQSLAAAAQVLGLEGVGSGDNTAAALARWTRQWRSQMCAA
ncbi:tRNA glutamyl-Q(34) synthetase GluQRS [Rhodoferax sp.]|uniref:tRNA glutamyl-Q(34) synthetase GluQRS n=1 Tax=Rhodoferax sp. TaxID=50421 RepID=UPI00378525F3